MLALALVMEALMVPVPLIVPALRRKRAALTPLSSAVSRTPSLSVIVPVLVGDVEVAPVQAADVRTIRRVLTLPMKTLPLFWNGCEKELEVLMLKRPLVERSSVPRL